MKRGRRRWLAVILVLPLVLAAALAIAALLLGDRLIQRLMVRLESQGLRGQVVEASLLPCRIQVQGLELVRRQVTGELQIKASEGSLSLDLWSALAGSNRVSTLRFSRPRITVRKWARQAPAPVKLTDGVRQLQRSFARHRQQALHVGELLIDRGSVDFVDSARSDVTTQVKIARIDVTLRGGLQGEMRFEGGSCVVQGPDQRVEIQVPQGSISVDLDELLDAKKPRIRDLLLRQPRWSVSRLGQVDDHERRERWQRQAMLKQQLRDLAPELERLRVVGGRFSLDDRATRDRQVQLRIERFDADLRRLKGQVKTSAITFSEATDPRSLRLRLPSAQLEVDLHDLLEGRIEVSSALLRAPSMEFDLRGGAPPASPRGPGQKPWLRVMQLRLNEGKLGLTFLPPRGGAGLRPLRLQITDLQADLQGLDLRYLLARPFSGSGQGRIRSYGRVRFRAGPTSKGSHRFELLALPVKAVNQMLDAERIPLQIKRGRLSTRIDLNPLDQHRVRVSASFHLEGVAVEPRPGLRGLKQAALHGASAAINRYLEVHPEHQRLQASIMISPAELASQPPVLFRRLTRSLARALTEAATRKFPALGKARVLIKSKRARPPRGSKRSLGQRLRDRFGRRRGGREQ